jgi:hypothetical protein
MIKAHTVGLTRPALLRKRFHFRNMRSPVQVTQSNVHASTLKNAILLTKNSNARSAETFSPPPRWVGLSPLPLKTNAKTNP